MSMSDSLLPITNLFVAMIQFHCNIKLFHFQTANYSYHEASGKLYEEFEKKYDKLIEVFQGVYGKIPTVDLVIHVQTISDSNIVAYCKNYAENLAIITSELCSNKRNSPICNIIDEIIAEIERYMFVFSLK